MTLSARRAKHPSVPETSRKAASALASSTSAAGSGVLQRTLTKEPMSSSWEPRFFHLADPPYWPGRIKQTPGDLLCGGYFRGSAFFYARGDNGRLPPSIRV